MSSDLATLKLKVDVQGRLIRMLHRRRTEQTVTAANLLAHQQARGIEAREEEEQGVKDYLDLRDRADILAVEVATLRKQLEEREADMHRRIRAGYDRTIADSWRAELARKDAEIERLRERVELLTDGLDAICEVGCDDWTDVSEDGEETCSCHPCRASYALRESARVAREGGAP